MAENMEQFKIILRKVCADIKASFGSVDIVKTEGVQVLEQEGEHWIEVGATNLYEICARADDIKSMLANYGSYDDVKEQFMPDIFASWEDLIYHSSVFNIYYYSVLRRLSDNKNTLWYDEQQGLDNYLRNIDIDSIATDWSTNILDERKREIILELGKLSFIICDLCTKIKTLPQSVFEIFDKLHYFALKAILLQKEMHN